MNELEFIQFEKVNGMDVFLNTVDYRTSHFHQEWEVILVLENTLLVTCDGVTFEAEEGDILVLSPSKVHELSKKGESSTFLCLQIAASVMGISDQYVSTGVKLKDYLDSYSISYIRKGLINLLTGYLKMDNMYQIYCLGECNQIMYRILSNMPCKILSEDERTMVNRKNARLNRLMSYVEKNYMHKVNLGDFAKKEDVSLCYLSHFVKNSLNQTFQDYVNSVRFNHALSLIREDNRKLSEVCKMSGFSDYKYFSATFVKRYGKLPEEYAKEIRCGASPSIKSSEDSKSTESFMSREESLLFLENLKKRGVI